ncbi:alpha/beta fold hydrolase [Anaerocolumna sp. MB42-C2]|uniref:alpha/beta fold hydrolase n=1 Tax=Anaerocolumna sp. MB42-C2 TaxID=3070997 RepID=UPI0027DEEC17|nr:alpha/beta fold hydrolase [Anaerocolumna sp. MB42-C2]WMJ87087.1 alpha/beta fold hydrolase [Anaerocolumna sp. MB42-C2]
MKTDKIQFKMGSYQLNSDPNFNYQLNRTIMWGGGDIEDIKRIANKITDSVSWKRELIALGEKADEEGRVKEAIAYYRMSEFFMYDGDADKKKYYRLAVSMFYNYYRDYFIEKIIRYEVPYENVKLPVLYAKAKDIKKDTIILHGGNDSYMEELFFPMLYFAENGYDVYLFEGPGQGGVVRIQEKHFTYQWEKPVKAVLDYFGLKEVTIIGASLGGMLAPRAAAFEKRIKRVIAWSVFPNFLDILISTQSVLVQKIIRLTLMLKLKWVVNLLFGIKLKKGDELVKWGLKHGMYAYEAKSPYDYFVKMNQYQMVDIAPFIDQDMLIIGANKDHFIDYHMISKEIDVLNNVKSLTIRIFTEKENAGAHCNVGNSELVLDTMLSWIESIRDN